MIKKVRGWSKNTPPPNFYQLAFGKKHHKRKIKDKSDGGQGMASYHLSSR
jgi:hypothetical protein